MASQDGVTTVPGDENEDERVAMETKDIPKDHLMNGSVDHQSEDEDDSRDMPELIDTDPDAETLQNHEDASNKDGGAEKENKSEDQAPEWMEVIGNDQLKKKILREGQGAATRPQRGQEVTIRSKGSLEDGRDVDCHQEITFVLGEGDVISAWDLCLCLMDLGEVSLIKTAPRFAYGEIGREPDVPPNADITYKLELLKVQAARDAVDMTAEELCAMGDKKRDRGNELYSRKDYSGAINSYTKALKLLDTVKASSEDDVKQTVRELKVKCYNNLAAAQLKIDAYDPALKSCKSVLDIDPDNVKALFRKGKVQASRGDYDESIKTMKEALSREPASKVIHQELSRLTSHESKALESERLLCQRMVGDMASVTEINRKKRINKWTFLAVSIGVIILAVVAALSTQRFQPVF